MHKAESGVQFGVLHCDSWQKAWALIYTNKV